MSAPVNREAMNTAAVTAAPWTATTFRRLVSSGRGSGTNFAFHHGGGVRSAEMRS